VPAPPKSGFDPANRRLRASTGQFSDKPEVTIHARRPRTPQVSRLSSLTGMRFVAAPRRLGPQPVPVAAARQTPAATPQTQAARPTALEARE
jgi:hypothetical protein